jgi:hypothetical protein
MSDKPVPAPTDEDLRHDDLEYNPAAVAATEPRSAKAWLNLLEESEKAFDRWNDHCDLIDKQFANLERLANDNARDKEFQMFWANCEVLKPSIYAKAPVPIVTPKFKDRRPIYQAASEVLERVAVVSFDLTSINDLMMQVRDDLAICCRGVAWCRYESGGGKSHYDTERVCVDFKHRRDFLHSLSRSWPEVTWVAGASYLTRAEAKERFFKTSKDEYSTAEYSVDKDAKEVGGADERERAKFWEVWDKSNRRVVWVAKGCENILDEADPHLDVQGFFPCPKPAYGTRQRNSLVPVPDVLQYKDQLEEVNLLTGRIHALSDALELKGFYPSGGGELADAIQTAIKIKTGGRVLIPIANWAAFGGTKDVIIWLPIEKVAETITALVVLRKQVIEDIYQIMGLSDIMRGATDPQETLGAQQLKTEYGSSRVRDKQFELIRVARDLVGITSDIVCENFASDTIIEMSQTQLPTEAMQGKALAHLTQQLGVTVQKIQQAVKSPQAQQLQQQNPDEANQMMQQAQLQVQQLQDQIDKIRERPTIEQVLKFLRDKRSRAFILDIETDSTILADENAEKQRRTEFSNMLGTLLPQLAAMIAAEPQSAEFCGEFLKFCVAPFRAGRSLDGAIDGLVEQMKAKGAGPRGDDPTTATNKTALQIEQLKQQRQAEKDKADNKMKQQELAMRDRHEVMKIQSAENLKQMELQQRNRDDAAKAARTNQEAMAEGEAHQMDMVRKQADIQNEREKAAMQRSAEYTRNMERVQRARMPPPKGLT